MVNAKEQIESDIDQSTIDAFHKMWDTFPSMVMLLKKDRTILALNKVGRDLGIEPCIKCYQMAGRKGIHEGCKADLALGAGDAERSVSYIEKTKKVLDSYWLPITGEKDVYIHFATDITEYAKKEMFPASE